MSVEGELESGEPQGKTCFPRVFSECYWLPLKGTEMNYGLEPPRLQHLVCYLND